MKNIRANRGVWITGVVVAFAGVALARLVGPALAAGPVRLGCTLAGQLIALAGLGFICVGVSRRVRGQMPDA